MSQKQNLITTAEFAKASGIPTAKVSGLIRAGKIKAKKVSGRWQIDKSQLKAEAVAPSGKTAPAEKQVAAAAAAPKTNKSRSAAPKRENVKAPANKTAYSVSEFAAMTYLTEKGVMDWLKSGRLKGRMGSTGEWSVDAGNLQAREISRLVR